jgi:hypothetical protein
VTRVCTICTHAERGEIDLALVHREPYRHIASRFSVTTGSLQRHVNSGHIVERLRKVRDEEDVKAALDVATQLRAINSAAGAILKEAMEREEGEGTVRKDPSLALHAIDRVLRQLELAAKLASQLDERPVTNVFISEAAQAVIFGALVPYPKARMAVLRAVRSHDGHE